MFSVNSRYVLWRSPFNPFFGFKSSSQNISFQKAIIKNFITPFYSWCSTVSMPMNFYQEIAKGSWYSFDQPRKDEKLSCPWNRPIVLNCSKRYLYGRFIQKVPLNFRPKKDILKINLYAVLNLCGLHFL